MIVVDTSVLVYLLLPGERTEQAERVFRRDVVWTAPRLWRSEFRNVLAVYMRRGLLALDHALQLMDTAEGLMQGREYEVSSVRVLSLIAGTCSADDGEFVALAQDLGLSLVTSDEAGGDPRGHAPAAGQPRLRLAGCADARDGQPPSARDTHVRAAT